MRPTLRTTTAVVALFATLFALLAAPAVAQDTNDILRALERDGYYIEDGADASDSEMRALVRRGDASPDDWYFVVLAGPADPGYAAELRDGLGRSGNVVVHFVEFEGDEVFDNVDLATGHPPADEDAALVPFDGSWQVPADYMADVVDELDAIIAAGVGDAPASTPGSSTNAGSTTTPGGGGGFPWWILVIPAGLIGGGVWMSRRTKKKRRQGERERAQKIRAELQTELDELANDVLVLAELTDLSDKQEAITHYREATDTYLDISEELPDLDTLEDADLEELSELGARVAHARWQMDAAEAILEGEPVPDKPKVEPPPAPPTPPRPRTEAQRRLPQRERRPRVPYSPSRRRSGGGMLDVLIAGAGVGGGMLGGRSRGRGRSGGAMFGGSSRGRSGGAMFGGSSRGRSGGAMFGGSSRGRSGGGGSAASPRPGGGVFGQSARPSRSRSTRGPSSSRSSSSSRSRRSRSRSSGNRRSTTRSKRRRGRPS